MTVYRREELERDLRTQMRPCEEAENARLRRALLEIKRLYLDDSITVEQAMDDIDVVVSDALGVQSG